MSEPLTVERIDWQDFMLDALLTSDAGNNPFYADDDDTVTLANELGTAVAERLATLDAARDRQGLNVISAAQALVDEWNAAVAGDMPLNGHYQKQALDRLRATLDAAREGPCPDDVLNGTYDRGYDDGQHAARKPKP